MNRKIAIMAGNVYSSTQLFTFAPLGNENHVEVFLFYENQEISDLPKNLKLHIFADETGCGAFPNLENSLKDFDLVICFELARFWSLQAVKVCEENKIPLLVYVTETGVDYSASENLGAIENILCSFASCFLVPYHFITKELLKKGIDRNKILRLEPSVNYDRYKIDTAKRQKFRDAINMNQTDTVILFKGPLEKESSADEFIKAMKLFIGSSRTHDTAFKLLIVGQGSYSETLKHLAANLGLGSSTFFIHQNLQTLESDLYNASDIVVYPHKTVRKGFTNPLSYELLEARACGVIPIVIEGEIEQEMATHVSLRAGEKGYESIAKKFLEIYKNKNSLQEFHAINQKITLEHVLNEDERGCFLEALINHYCKTNLGEEHFTIEIPYIERKLASSDISQGISILHDFEKRAITDRERSVVASLRGKFYYQNFDFLKSLNSFKEALNFDGDYAASYVGLGYLAWVTHEHEESLTFFRRAFKLDPFNFDANFGLGMVFRRVKLFHDALFWLKRGLVLAKPLTSTSALSTNALSTSADRALFAIIQLCFEWDDRKKGLDVLTELQEELGEHPALTRGIETLSITSSTNKSTFLESY